jgi:hypothetical protein
VEEPGYGEPARQEYRHTDYRAHTLPTLDELSPEATECYNLENPYVLAVPTGRDAQLCRHAAIVYASGASTWVGREAPLRERVESQTKILRADAMGRPR